MPERKYNRYVAYPEFGIKFITETSEYNIRYATSKDDVPSDKLMSQSVISMTTKNAMEDDSAVFSFVLSGDVYWDRILAPNDVVILKIIPDTKNSASFTSVTNDTVLVGLVNEVRLEADYGENSKMYRISGQSFAKILIDFEIGVIQEVSVVLSEVGWLPDDSSTGLQFSTRNASEIAYSMLSKFLNYTRYKFKDGRTIDEFFEYDGLDSWTEYESLANPLPFINYEGSLKQMLDDIAEKPFNEVFFDFTQDETCKLIMRRTPFDESDWNNLPAHVITSKAVISESVAKNDTEVASIFNVIVDNPLGMDSVDFGSFPRYYQALVDKYGYSKLELKNKYLQSVLNSTDDSDSSSDADTTDKPEGRELEVEATAYSYKQAGLSNLTATGIDLRERPKVLAVDPSVIPLGSDVWVEGMGNYIAGDTGGDIKGSRIDIHMTSVEDCLAFGRKKIKVVIKKEGSSNNSRSASPAVQARTATARTSTNSSVKSMHSVILSYLKAQPVNTLRVRKTAVASKIVSVDSRIDTNKANAIIDSYLKTSSFSIDDFTRITGINDKNVDDAGDLKITYSKLKKFLKDYKDKTIQDRDLVRDAIMKEFKSVDKDKATTVASTFLEAGGELKKSEYEKIFTNNSTDGVPTAQDVNAEALKIFTEKITNWYCENGNFYAGEIKVVGHPNYRMGNRLIYNDEQNNEIWEYYIEGVQHDYSYSSGFVTTLSVTRGLQEGGISRFSNLWGKSEEFKGGLLGEPSLAELFEQGKASQNSGGSSSGSSSSGNYPASSSKQVEKAISWFREREGKVHYSMGENGPRTGPNSYDCSAAVFSALIYAGILPEGTWLGNTESLYQLEGSLLISVDKKDVQRGDIFVAGVKGASLNADGHTGMFLDRNNIIHCSSSANGIAETPAQGYMGDARGLPVYYYRIKGVKKDG